MLKLRFYREILYFVLYGPAFASFGLNLNGEKNISPPAVTTTAVRQQARPGSHRARVTWTTALGFAQKMLHVEALVI